MTELNWDERVQLARAEKERLKDKDLLREQVERLQREKILIEVGQKMGERCVKHGYFAQYRWDCPLCRDMIKNGQAPWEDK